MDSEVYQGDLGPSSSNSKHSADVYQTIKKTLFIVGSASIVFAALSNTLTYQLQRFWGASGSFWQHQWDNVLNTFGDDTFNLFVFGSFIVGYIVYWGFGAIYTLMDITGLPKSIRRYKIQPGTNETLEASGLLKLVLIVNLNQIVALGTAVGFFYLFKLRGIKDIRHLPTLHWVLFELVVFILADEIGFYYAHRLFHHRMLYKHFHKLHHEWQAPIAVTAIYCHPLEHILANIVPIFAGPLLLGSHLATTWLWVAIATLSTLNAHSGYHLPFFPSPEAHDFHHLKFNQCYGVLGILDFLHGTDNQFRNTKSFSRHIMMLSFIPPNEAFPEDSKKNVKGKFE